MKKATKKQGKPGPKKYGPHMVKAAARLAGKGCSNEKISEGLKVTVDTFYRWRREHPEFDEAISDARLGDLDEIEAALFKRARGYSYEEVTTEYTVPAGCDPEDVKAQEKKIKVTKKQMAPSESAHKFILSNRRKARWSEKIEAEVSGGLSIEIGLPESLGGSAPSESDSEE